MCYNEIMSFILAPSLLAADFTNLQKEIELVNESEADWLHVDVMDGMFVPNITIGMPVVKAIKKHARKPFDVHLMIVEPERYFEAFAEAGADILVIHFETSANLAPALSKIRSLGMQPGLALNPNTPVPLIKDLIPYCDVVLLMSVHPGFGGQKFIENTYERLDDLVKLKNEFNSNLIIEVDGGVNLENAPQLLRHGADALVAGKAIFGADDVLTRIKEFKTLG